MTVSGKIKTIDKVEQKKVQCNLNIQTAKIFATSSGNVSRYKFLTAEGNLPEKKMLEKAATITTFGYLVSGSVFKKQTSTAKVNTKNQKRFVNLIKNNIDKVKNSDKTKNKKNFMLNLFYSNKFTFFKHFNIESVLIFFCFKKNYVEVFKTKSKLLYDGIEEIKATIEDKKNKQKTGKLCQVQLLSYMTCCQK